MEGNLWLYGGVNHYGWYGDLWKFFPTINEWAWIKGTGIINHQRPIYGTLGVPSINNTPGQRSEIYSWVDTSGNLWLFGGIGYDTAFIGSSVSYNDLWKY